MRAIGVRRASESTLSVFEAMAPGHASVLLKRTTGGQSVVVATVLLAVSGPPVDSIAAATHLVWMKQSDEERSRYSGSALGTCCPSGRLHLDLSICWRVLLLDQPLCAYALRRELGRAWFQCGGEPACAERQPWQHEQGTLDTDRTSGA